MSNGNVRKWIEWVSECRKIHEAWKKEISITKSTWKPKTVLLLVESISERKFGCEHFKWNFSQSLFDFHGMSNVIKENFKLLFIKNELTVAKSKTLSMLPLLLKHNQSHSKTFHININDILRWKLIKWLNRISDHVFNSKMKSQRMKSHFVADSKRQLIVLLYSVWLFKMKSMGQHNSTHKYQTKTCFGIQWADWHRQIRLKCSLHISSYYLARKTDNNDIFLNWNQWRIFDSANASIQWKHCAILTENFQRKKGKSYQTLYEA